MLRETIRQILKEKIVFAVTLVILAILLLRPMVILRNGHPERIEWGMVWTEISITFVNSVTERIVEIFCYPLWKFSRFKARTDLETEFYYTNGNYKWNDLLSKEQVSTLTYCSLQGVTICFNGRCFSTEDGCLGLKLLWP